MVYFCVDQNQLKLIIEKLSESKKARLVIQKYIKGETIAVEAIYKDGTLMGYTYATVVKTLKDEFGISSERHYSVNPDIETSLAQIGHSFGINGFATMTFMFETRTSKHYLVEADLRPQGWFRLGAFCGVDFSKVIQNFLDNKNILYRPLLLDGKAYLTMWRCFRDVRRCLQLLDWVGLWRWSTNADNRWRFIIWYDWKMSLRLLLRAVTWIKYKLQQSLRIGIKEI